MIKLIPFTLTSLIIIISGVVKKCEIQSMKVY